MYAKSSSTLLPSLVMAMVCVEVNWPACIPIGPMASEPVRQVATRRGGSERCQGPAFRIIDLANGKVVMDVRPRRWDQRIGGQDEILGIDDPQIRLILALLVYQAIRDGNATDGSIRRQEGLFEGRPANGQRLLG